MKEAEGNWNFFDRLKGDKVVWMIVLMLIMWSIVCIFSSTSSLKPVLTGAKTRVDVVNELLLVIGIGFGFLLLVYNFFGSRCLRFLGKIGFIGSAALLIFVNCHVEISDSFKASTINDAWRVIKVGHFQVHIYEIIKVAMVMYMAWAVDTFLNKDFKLLNKLAEMDHLHWLKKPMWQKVICIYFPLTFVMLMVAVGSGSSAGFIGVILLATVLIGGVRDKGIVIPILAVVGLVAGIIVLNKVTDGGVVEKFPRAQTWASRMGGMEKHLEKVYEAAPNSDEYRRAIDKIRQPYSAKIAIKQGGFLGKGAGQSTQRYVVPVMYEDYMFSFIVEEYGLWGAFIIIILYISLLARGTVIVKGCTGRFEKITVAGLVILITGQAMLHMFVNVGIGPLTGQTLPLVSYGSSSFVCFCVAFGIILSISRGARRNIEKEREASGRIQLEHQEELMEEMDSEV